MCVQLGACNPQHCLGSFRHNAALPEGAGRVMAAPTMRPFGQRTGVAFSTMACILLIVGSATYLGVCQRGELELQAGGGSANLQNWLRGWRLLANRNGLWCFC